MQTLAAAADEVVGKTKRSASEYSLVYRSVDHRSLRLLCFEADKPTLPAKYARYAPNGFASDIQAFAGAVLDLQDKRHAADYDPSIRVTTSDAVVAIDTARDTLNRFAHADPSERTAFLTLLLFMPR